MLHKPNNGRWMSIGVNLSLRKGSVCFPSQFTKGFPVWNEFYLPGQIMVRRTILPHLLGFRMNLLSLLPLIFGIMLYVAKNAFVFSKVTLVLSTLMTLKSLFLLQHLKMPTHGNEFADTGGWYLSEKYISCFTGFMSRLDHVNLKKKNSNELAKTDFWHYFCLNEIQNTTRTDHSHHLHWQNSV